MFDWWQSFRDTWDETTSNIRWCVGAVGMIAAITVVVGQWMSSLNTLQIVALYVVIGCLLIIGITFFTDWRRKKNVDSIPELLSKLDQMALDYIDAYDRQLSKEDSDLLLRDTEDILRINFRTLRKAMEEKDRKRVQTEFQQLLAQISRVIDFKKDPGKSLNTLQVMAETLDEYKVGLANLQGVEGYQRIHGRVKGLQRRIAHQDTNVKINAYFNWSRGLYSLALTIKPLISSPERDLLPVSARAMKGMFRPMIQDHTTSLISAVSESIAKNKERRKGE
jgi:hypothetical protein